jgi:uncharacterized phage-associated protein
MPSPRKSEVARTKNTFSPSGNTSTGQWMDVISGGVVSSGPYSISGPIVQSHGKRVAAGAITANDIAAWIIEFCNERGDPITNLKLQRLLYYAQAWHVALRGRPLFKEDFQAWVNGPIQPGVFAAYRQFSFAPIPHPIYVRRSIPAAIESHLKDVLQAYGFLSAYDLELLASSELPWCEARKGLAPDTSSTQPIAIDAMRRFYKAKLNEQRKA